MGVETFGIHGVISEQYENLLAETLKCHPHIVIDGGGWAKLEVLGLTIDKLTPEQKAYLSSAQ